MIEPARLLGFAFANADLLFEIDREGTVSFATGAASEFARDGELVGRGAAKLFEPSEGVKFVTFARALGRGGRAGPLKLKLANGTAAHVSLCNLPLNGGRISCTLSKIGARTNFDAAGADAKTGLDDRESFLSAAKSMVGSSASMTLVDVPGLKDACSKLPAEQADKLFERIGKAVKDGGDRTAGRLSETGFAAIDAASPKQGLGARIKGALKEGGLAALSIEESLVSLKGKELSPEQRILAVRYVVDRFANGTHEDIPRGLGDAFDAMLEETEKRALAFTGKVIDGAFALNFQPIFHLESARLSHFEALARFSAEQNTGEAIKFAEALGIADALDLAAAAKVLATVEDDPQAGAVALNLSGRTLTATGAFGLIAGLFAKKRKFAKRVLVEITETADIGDLSTANSAVQALRGLGYRVGLDDFGAGAASLQYLHAFTVDYVKFDGSLIKKIGQSKRDDLLLAGMVKLCRELGVETIAECIESAEVKQRCRELGFDLGQGWFLGKPGPFPVLDAAAAKRKGYAESWG